MHPTHGADDELTGDVSLLWQKALSKSTLVTYASALTSFLSFLAISSLVPAWPASTLPAITEHTLIQYVAYCQNSLHLRYDTIKLYLAGIRFNYIKQNNCDILKHNLQLNYILRGVKKSQHNVKGVRLPITFVILSDMCCALSTGVFTPFLDLMLSCIFTTAFYGFLRCGEFTYSSQISQTFLQISDIIILQDLSSFTLRLRTSKTDPFGSGISIPIFNTKPLLPVAIMQKYLSIRRQAGAQPHDPLFVESQDLPSPLHAPHSLASSNDYYHMLATTMLTSVATRFVSVPALQELQVVSKTISFKFWDAGNLHVTHVIYILRCHLFISPNN